MDMASNLLFGQILTLELVSKDRDFFFLVWAQRPPSSENAVGIAI